VAVKRENVVEDEEEEEDEDEEVDEVVLVPLVEDLVPLVEGLSVGLVGFEWLLPGNMSGAGNKLLDATLHQHLPRTTIQWSQHSQRQPGWDYSQAGRDKWEHQQAVTKQQRHTCKACEQQSEGRRIGGVRRPAPFGWLKCSAPKSDGLLWIGGVRGMVQCAGGSLGGLGDAAGDGR
jgi:hypothetical protein